MILGARPGATSIERARVTGALPYPSFRAQRRI